MKKIFFLLCLSVCLFAMEKVTYFVDQQDREFNDQLLGSWTTNNKAVGSWYCSSPEYKDVTYKVPDSTTMDFFKEWGPGSMQWRPYKWNTEVSRNSLFCEGDSIFLDNFGIDPSWLKELSMEFAIRDTNFDTTFSAETLHVDTVIFVDTTKFHSGGYELGSLYPLASRAKICEELDIPMIINYVDIHSNPGIWDDLFYEDSVFSDTVCTYTYNGVDYYYYEYEIENFVKPFIEFTHYLFSTDTDSGWGAVRADTLCDDHPEPLECVKYISIGNDGPGKLRSRWLKTTDLLEDEYRGRRLPISPGTYLDEEQDTIDYYENSWFYYRLANTYARIYSMCVDSFRVNYPEQSDVDIAPMMLYLYRSRISDFDEIDFRDNDMNYIFTREIAKYLDEKSPIDNRPYAGHISFNYHYFLDVGGIDSITQEIGEVSNCGCKDYAYAGGKRRDIKMTSRLLYGANNCINKYIDFDFSLTDVAQHFIEDFGITNPIKFGFNEFSCTLGDAGHYSQSQCGILFPTTIMSALCQYDFYNSFMSDHRKSEYYPEILYANRFYYTNGGACMITGFSDTLNADKIWNSNSSYSREEFDLDTDFNHFLYDSVITAESFPEMDSLTGIYCGKPEFPGEVVWKNGDPFIKQAGVYVHWLLRNKFGNIILNSEEEFSDTSFAIVDTSISTQILATSISRKYDGTVCALVCNKQVDCPETLQIILDGDIPEIDSIKTYTLTGRYDEWYARINKTFPPFDNGSGIDSTWVQSFFINNNRPQYWACDSYAEYVYIDSTCDSSSCTQIWTEEISGGDTTITHLWEAGFTPNDTFYLELPKHSIVAIQVFPSTSDTFNLVLNPGWNLISIPLFTNGTILSDYFPDTCISIDTIPYGIGTADTLIDSTFSIMRYDPNFPDNPYIDNRYEQYVNYADSVFYPGKGYWIYNPDTSDLSVSIPGFPVSGYREELLTGFNMVGSVWEDTVLADFTGDCADRYYSPCTLLVNDMFIGYDNSIENYVFNNSNVIQGNGYFVLTTKHDFMQFPDSVFCCDSDSFMRELDHQLLYTMLNEPDNLTNHHFTPIFRNDSIIALDCSTKNPVPYTLVYIEHNDTFKIAYTDSIGRYRDDFTNASDSVDIYLYKPGYEVMFIPHYGARTGNINIPNGDVYVTGDLIINAGDTLSIAKGTNIFIEPDSDGSGGGIDSTFIEILVKGVLIANGDSSDPVVFVPDTTDTSISHWSGIVVQDSGSVNINHAEIEYCHYGMYGDNCGPISMSNVTLKGGARINVDYTQSTASKVIQLDNVSSSHTISIISHEGDSWVKNSTFDGLEAPMIVMSSLDTLDVTNCEFESFGSYGISASNAAKLKIENCSFKKGAAKTSALLLNNSTAKMYNSTIDSCSIGVYASNGAGFWAGDTTSPDGEAGNIIQHLV